MAIKVVCVTKSGTETHHRVIIEKPSTPINMIDVADRFLDLQRDHALVHGPEFLELRCYLDDIHVQTRYLVENASSFFYAVRQKYFNERNCTIYKHPKEVMCFMEMVRTGAQPTCMPPPVWRDPRVIQNLVAGRTRGTGQMTIALPIEAIEPVELESDNARGVNAPEPAVSAQVSPPAPRRLKPSNLGALGKLN
jgi:hypothetical protein